MCKPPSPRFLLKSFPFALELSCFSSKPCPALKTLCCGFPQRITGQVSWIHEIEEHLHWQKQKSIRNLGAIIENIVRQSWWNARVPDFHAFRARPQIAWKNETMKFIFGPKLLSEKLSIVWNLELTIHFSINDSSQLFSAFDWQSQD